MVDLLILTYNQEKYTQEVIKRFRDNPLINQVIICDNNSDIPYQIEETDKIKFISLNYSGLDNRASARNILFDFSTAEYVWSIDGDCIPEQSDLLLIEQFINKYPNSILYGTKKFTKFEWLEKPNNKIMDNFYNKFNLKFEQKKWADFFSFSYVCPKSAKIYYDGNLRGWGFEDFDIAYRWHKQGFKIYNCFFFQQNHIHHKGSFEIDENMPAIRRNYDYMLKKYPENQEILENIERMFTQCRV